LTRVLLGLLFVSSLLCVYPSRPLLAQENPYFVTYDHNLEEPGNLEIEYFSTFGTQRSGNDFHAFWMEFEYGVNAWWTTELYLDGQSTFRDSTIFTGIKWENRFRPLKREHLINPVLYVEFEHKSDADKTMKEGEGQLRKGINNEVELKLILSSNFKGWNFSQNTLAAKNLANSPWEFGYALAASRPLALKASATRCRFCRQNFTVGAEMYGGLGDRYSFGLKNTSHYLAAVGGWNLSNGWTFRLSPGFGLNDDSHKFLLRWGISREISGFDQMIRRMFGGKS